MPQSLLTVATPQQLATTLQPLLINARLGLQQANGFVPAPVSLTPWQLSHTEWQQALTAATLLGRLLERIAKDPLWLLQQSRALQDSASMPGAIWRTLSAIKPAHFISQNVNLSRHDLLLTAGGWRWVESNPIAAGMGPLSARYQQLLPPLLPWPYVDNPALAAQAKLLAEAAIAGAAGQLPLLVMVVAEHESNIFDQQLLAEAIQQQGVSVARLTLQQLQQGQPRGAAGFYLADGRRVALLYWRTGYNPLPQAPDYWAFRADLEQTDLLQCPNLTGQLSGSKWLQHQLGLLLQQESGQQQLSQRFGLSPAQLEVLQQLSVPSVAVADLTAAEVSNKLAAGYWYKTQQEGGGNVARYAQGLQRYQHFDNADLLMAPINATIRRENFYSLKHGELLQSDSAGQISELGIFTLGSAASYGGYLCRSKASSSLEGGISYGAATLDLISLKPQCCSGFA
jgi:hypothetical protein